jgi:hypothetical protein
MSGRVPSIKYIKAYRRQLRRELDEMGYPGNERQAASRKISSSDRVERSPVWRLVQMALLVPGGEARAGKSR